MVLVMADESILDLTKKLVGLDPEYDAFDLEIITHINTVFFALKQLGVGPDEGFMITSRTEKWADYIGYDDLNAVKSYMGLRVRMLFDPPATSFTQDSMKNAITELEWRLNVHMEGVRHEWDDLPMNS